MLSQVLGEEREQREGLGNGHTAKDDGLRGGHQRLGPMGSWDALY